MPRILYAGADIRRHPALADTNWTPERRKQYLLRTDVVRPLSVDRLVWDVPRGPDAPAEQTPLPWFSPDDVYRQAAASGTGQGRWVVVAIGAVAENPEEETAIARGTGSDSEIKVLPEWTFLGFDVTDGSISGLCNCGYHEPELAILRPTWASRLNEHGLFSEMADALAFRKLTDERVTEHAPFYVYGMWIVGPALPA